MSQTSAPSRPQQLLQQLPQRQPATAAGRRRRPSALTAAVTIATASRNRSVQCAHGGARIITCDSTVLSTVRCSSRFQTRRGRRVQKRMDCGSGAMTRNEVAPRLSGSRNPTHRRAAETYLGTSGNGGHGAGDRGSASAPAARHRVAERSDRPPYYRFYFRTIVGGKFLCVVVKLAAVGAFVLTAYLTDRIKKGSPLWPNRSDA